jgi:hypothetical protein
MTTKGRQIEWGTLLGLVIAAVGVVSPIVWDRYKSSSAIELRQLSSSVIVSDARGIEKLQFIYDGQPVRSVGKLDFALRNSGRSVIRAVDVVSAPTIAFINGRILDVRVTGLAPSGLQASWVLDEGKTRVEFRLPLMNPDDTLNVTLLVSPADAPISASARIAGVRDLVFVPAETAATSVAARVPWTFWVVASFTAGCLLLGMTAMFALGKESEIDALAKQGAFTVPAAGTVRHYRQFLDETVPEKKTELKSVKDWLSTLPDDSELRVEEVGHFRTMVFEALQDRRAARSAVWFLLVLIVVGTWYLASVIIDLLSVQATSL